MKHARGETKQLLLDTAKRLFTEGGYVSTTVRQIASEANLSTGTFYHFFESKEDLVIALCDTDADVYDLLDNLDEKVKEPMFHLTKLLHSYADFWTHLGWGLGSQFILNVVPDLDAVTTVRSVQSFIEAAQNAGTMNCKLTPKEATEYIFTNATGLLYKWIMLKGNYNLKRLSERFAPILLQGLM